MELRIASGQFNRAPILIPAQAATLFRPTGQRVRNAVAQVLGMRIADAHVGDFCAGSGAFGFEMLSRGAAWVDFIEQNRILAAAIKENALRLKCADRCTVVAGDVLQYIDTCEKRYDIIYCDPPYENSAVYAGIPAMAVLLAPSGVLLVERRKEKSRRTSGAPTLEGLQCQSREYGDTVVDIYWRG